MPNIKYTTVEADEDTPTDRVTEIDGFTVERRDPYGNWWFQTPLSRALEGSFTNIDEVRKAIFKHNSPPKIKKTA